MRRPRDNARLEEEHQDPSILSTTPRGVAGEVHDGMLVNSAEETRANAAHPQPAQPPAPTANPRFKTFGAVNRCLAHAP